MTIYAAGRWTTEEHNLFLEGLRLHQKQWKSIADLVKTRTVVQIRTHAQKYFQKMEKSQSHNFHSSEESTSTEVQNCC
jgi:SHAQKYF class myb-like DNA-binding protein